MTCRWGLPAAPSTRGRPLTDGGAVVLAVMVLLGAWAARPVPWPVGVGGVAVALAVRRPWLLWVGAALLTSTLGARAEAALRPARPATYQGTVTLVTDPEVTLGGVRAAVRAGNRRLELQASGGAAGALLRALAGERLAVTGRIRPPPPGETWLRTRHIVGRLDTRRAEPVSGGSALWRAANRVRRLLGRGAISLPRTSRSLFTGFVLGDDRDQPPTVTDDFRGAGLTHLLAVSGQNVAFVLALVNPAIRRCRLAVRWAATVGVIVFFAFVTRGEPSVLRASVMAGLAVTASSLGRRASPIRLLALAVAALVLIDPFLIGSTGFQLSVGASVGIVTMAKPLGLALPGPAPLAEGLAVTLAAQLGVAPVLLTTFGGVPVVSVPANLLAVPVAGLVMMWGLGAGLVAGVVGEPLARLLHLPTQLMISWIAGVARNAAALPLGELHRGEVGALGGGLASFVVARRRRAPRIAAAAAGSCIVALVVPAVALKAVAPPLRTEPIPGVIVWRAERATVAQLTGPVSVARLLEAIRRIGVRRIDLVIAQSGGATASSQVQALRHRWPVRRVLQPAGGSAPGATGVQWPTVLLMGPFIVEIVPVGKHLHATVLRLPRHRSGAFGPRVRSVGDPRNRSPPRLGRSAASAITAPARPGAFGPTVGSARDPRARSPPLRRHASGDRDGGPQPHARLVLRPRRVLLVRRVPP